MPIVQFGADHTVQISSARGAISADLAHGYSQRM
jgi:hypothetical protein